MTNYGELKRTEHEKERLLAKMGREAFSYIEGVYYVRVQNTLTGQEGYAESLSDADAVFFTVPSEDLDYRIGATAFNRDFILKE